MNPCLHIKMTYNIAPNTKQSNTSKFDTFEFFLNMGNSFKKSIMVWQSFDYEDWNSVILSKSDEIPKPKRHEKETNLSYTLVPDEIGVLKDNLRDEERSLKMSAEEFNHLMYDDRIFEWFPIDPFVGLNSVSRKVEGSSFIGDHFGEHFDVGYLNPLEKGNVPIGQHDLFHVIWMNNYDLIHEHYKDDPIEVERHKIIRNRDFAGNVTHLRDDPDAYVIWWAKCDLIGYGRRVSDEKE